MAEAIAISLSAKLAVALSRSAALGLSPLFGVRSEIAAAARDLDLLRAFLRFADSHHGADALAAAWVKQVRDAAFELEDVADECCYLSAHGRAWGWVNVRAWFALLRQLRKAREKLRQLSATKKHYGIRPAADGPAPAVGAISQMLAESAHFVEKEEIVGFAAHERQLREWVVEDPEPRRTLVSVWGMGGVGKTTLVTRGNAPLRLRRRFTVDDLLRKIIKELHHGGGDADADYRSRVEAVRRHLKGRRYLVVLDDVWDAHLLDKLRHAFLDDETGSRVVITTRSRDVANAAAHGRTMMLEPLPWRESWTLFCNVAFKEAPGRSCPSHLQEIAASVLERCRGLPLAIVSVGNILALKDTTEFAWSNVRDSLVWDRSSSDLGIGEAASILNLSIDDLPHHLRKCFLSCSIYPEDFLIKRKILIRMWVAQGFVDDRLDHRTAEDVADDYLDQLVQRSLMQAVVRNEFGRAKRCLVHDLIRELITLRSREEQGFFRFVNCRVTVDSSTRIRNLALDRCEAVDSRLLTVLNLWFIEMNKLPDSVTNLHNLRYLGIRSTLVEELPRDLGKLQKLQTLDCKLSMVRRLPSSTAKLKSLRHLILFTREAADFWKAFPAPSFNFLKA
ncbi:disease resistance protein RPM1-like [Panicum miliaceum]|uniref:Disease resistance protein RPM1-like n=1 Tax=Panicum miliaceum TaxID=4540 RepID=A0A3L6QNV2_PANMI|nr:disease resistance protein RPM1-like [Panicum miliaceum]